MRNRFISNDEDLEVEKPASTSKDNTNKNNPNNTQKDNKDMPSNNINNLVKDSDSNEKLEALAKKRKLSDKEKKGEDRNAVPEHKGGRKPTPHHPINPKAKLLKELHENKEVQKILEKHKTLDIIVVDKEKTNK